MAHECFFECLGVYESIVWGVCRQEAEDCAKETFVGMELGLKLLNCPVFYSGVRGDIGAILEWVMEGTIVVGGTVGDTALSERMRGWEGGLLGASRELSGFYRRLAARTNGEGSRGYNERAAVERRGVVREFEERLREDSEDFVGMGEKTTLTHHVDLVRRILMVELKAGGGVGSKK